MALQTRKDQVHAYRFLLRRQFAALLHGEPDSPEAPMRKLGVATFSGLMVAVLLAAVAGVIGVLAPSAPTSWRSGTALVELKDTGTRYVYAGGVLHPVLNTTSARLLLRSANPTTVQVGAGDISGVPRGLPVGIPGAPETLPSAGALLPSPWTVCSYPATDAAGNVRPFVKVELGAQPDVPEPGTGAGLLIEGSDGNLYLVWHHERLRLGAAYVRAALGYSTTSPSPVGDALLTVLPQGPDLAAPTIPGRGGAGPTVGGQPTRVGEVFTVTNIGSAPQSYVVYTDGLAPVTPTVAALLLADPATAAAYPGAAVAPVPLTPGAQATAPVSAVAPAPDPDLPTTPPTVEPSAGPAATCASYTGSAAADASGTSVDVTVRAVPMSPGDLAAVGAGTTPLDGTGPLADEVSVPPGRGSLVRALPAPGLADGTLYLVTDLGVKYPLPDDTSTLSYLGLRDVGAVPVPAVILQLLRTGPELDPADAAQTSPVLPDVGGSPQQAVPTQAPTTTGTV